MPIASSHKTEAAVVALQAEQAETLRRVEHSALALVNLVNDTLHLGLPASTAIANAITERPTEIAHWLVEENARLVAALEQSERWRLEFARTMSHQLRVPLNAIIGYHDLLLEDHFGSLTGSKRTRCSGLGRACWFS